jgi:hypothetical protein
MWNHISNINSVASDQSNHYTFLCIFILHGKGNVRGITGDSSVLLAVDALDMQGLLLSMVAMVMMMIITCLSRGLYA